MMFVKERIFMRKTNKISACLGCFYPPPTSLLHVIIFHICSCNSYALAYPHASLLIDLKMQTKVTRKFNICSHNISYMLLCLQLLENKQPQNLMIRNYKVFWKLLIWSSKEHSSCNFINHYTSHQKQFREW